jgi:hypothetical protein
MGSAHPPLEYLLASSKTSLESFEPSRLNAVANLRKEIREVVDDWVQAEIEARIARWVLECQRNDAAAPQPDVPQLLGPAGVPGNAPQHLMAAPKVDPPPRGRKESSSAHPSQNLARTQRSLGPKTPYRASQLGAAVQSKDQRLLFEDLNCTPDPSAANDCSRGSRRDELAFRAEHSLEGFVRLEARILRRNLHHVVVEKIGLPGLCSTKPLSAFVDEGLPAKWLSQNSSPTDCDTCPFVQ